MANPYFQKNSVFARTALGHAAPDTSALEKAYAAPDASSLDTGRMSYEGTVVKTSGLLILMFGVAAFTWIVMPALFIPGLIVAFVLSLVLIFKKKPSAGLTIAYAVAEGVFLGGISQLLDSQPGYSGIALQALLATGVTTAVCLWLYRSGRVRVTAGFTRVLMIGMISYGIFSLINMFLIFGGMDGWGMRSKEVGGVPIGLIVGAVAIILASMSLIMDFDGIKRAVERGTPAPYEWAAAFGLILTLVWLYLEFIRIFAIARDR